jgi:hypothetical protein
MVELAEIAQDQENLVIHQAAVVAQTLLVVLRLMVLEVMVGMVCNLP